MPPKTVPVTLAKTGSACNNSFTIIVTRKSQKLEIREATFAFINCFIVTCLTKKICLAYDYYPYHNKGINSRQQIIRHHSNPPGKFFQAPDTKWF